MILERQLLLNIRLNRLHWFGHVQRMEENKIPERVLYINLGTTGLRGRQRNRSQDGIRGAFRPRLTRQLPRAVDLKGRLLSCQSY